MELKGLPEPWAQTWDAEGGWQMQHTREQIRDTGIQKSAGALGHGGCSLRAAPLSPERIKGSPATQMVGKGLLQRPSACRESSHTCCLAPTHGAPLSVATLLPHPRATSAPFTNPPSADPDPTQFLRPKWAAPPGGSIPYRLPHRAHSSGNIYSLNHTV